MYSLYDYTQIYINNWFKLVLFKTRASIIRWFSPSLSFQEYHTRSASDLYAQTVTPIVRGRTLPTYLPRGKLYPVVVAVAESIQCLTSRVELGQVRKSLGLSPFKLSLSFLASATSRS